MSRNYPYSPSQLKGYRDNPVSTLFSKYVERKSYSISGFGSARMGTEVHKYIGDAFETMKGMKGKTGNPSQKQISEILENSMKASEVNLRMHTSGMAKEGADRIIRHFGEQYLSNPSIDLFSESPLSGNISSSLGSWEMQGRPDFVLYDAEKRLATIVDIKNVLSSRAMSSFDNVSKDLQAKSYSALLLKAQQIAGKNIPIDEVNFIFAVNNPVSGVTDWSRSETITKNMLARLETELSVELANAQNLEKMSYNAFRGNKSSLDAFRDIYSDVIMTRGCTPGRGCRGCVMRYSCHLRFTWELGEGISAAREADSRLNERALKQVNRFWDEATGEDSSRYAKAFEKDRETAGGAGEIFDYEAAAARKRFVKQRVGSLELSGLDSRFIGSTVAAEVSNLRQSQDTMKRFLRGRFEGSMLDDAIDYSETLPYSALERVSNKLPHQWLSSNFVNSVKSVAYDSADSILRNIGVDRPEMVNRIVDRAFRDRKFVNDLDSLIRKNVSNSLVEKGLLPNTRNVVNTMEKVGKILDNAAVTSINDHVGEYAVRDIMKFESDRLSRYIPRHELESMSSHEAIFNRMKSSGISGLSPEDISRSLSGMETAFAKRERFRLSMPKNILSTMTKAAILSQLAGNETIYRMIANKADKAAFLFNQDDEIDTGEHNSTYLTVRRLVLSDFGSHTRKFLPVSSMFSWISARGSRTLSMVKDTMHRAKIAVSAAEFAPETAATARSVMMYGGIAAAGALALTSLVPRSSSPLEYRKYSREKGRFLRKEKENGMRKRDSGFQEPESPLRQQYKVPGQFGSPVSFILDAMRTLEAIPLSGVMDYVAGLTKSPAARTAARYGRSVSNVIRKTLTLDVAEKVSEEAASDYRGFLSSSVKRIASSVTSGVEQVIREHKVTVFARERLKYVWEHTSRAREKAVSSGKLSSETADIAVSYAGNAITRRKRNRQPVVVSHPAKHPDQIVVRTRSRRMLPHQPEIHNDHTGFRSNYVPDRKLTRKNIPSLQSSAVTRYMLPDPGMNSLFYVASRERQIHESPIHARRRVFSGENRMPAMVKEGYFAEESIPAGGYGNWDDMAGANMKYMNYKSMSGRYGLRTEDFSGLYAGILR